LESKSYRSWRSASRQVEKKNYAAGAQDVQEEKSRILSQLSKNSAWHHATRTLQLRMVATDIDPQSIQRRRR
jgi:hypothetical protein